MFDMGMQKEKTTSSKELSDILREYFDQRKKGEKALSLELSEVKEEMQRATESFQNCMQTQKLLAEAFEYLNQKK